MSTKYEIHFFDPNPCCTDSDGKKRMKWVPDPTNNKEPMTFDSQESALEERDRLQTLSEIYECPECHGVFRNSELTYFVKRIPEFFVAVESIEL